MLAQFLSLVCASWICPGSYVSKWALLGWVIVCILSPQGQVHSPFYHVEEPHTSAQVLLRVGLSQCMLSSLTQRHGCLAFVWHPASVKGEQISEGGLSLGTDKRNVHMLRCREVILAYTCVNLNLMLSKIACLRSITRTLYVCFNY